MYIDHEEVDNLLGGDENGHYHITREQLDWILSQMEGQYKPVIHDGQVITIPAGSEMDGYKIETDNIE